MTHQQYSIFMTTRWTLVGEAVSGGDEESAQRALGDLFRIYWQPLYRFLRRNGKNVEDAEDLVQDVNRYFERIGNPTTRMSYGLAMTYCIISILTSTIGLLPVIGSIIGMPSMIFGYLFLMQQRDCLLGMLQHRLGQRQTAITT